MNRMKYQRLLDIGAQQEKPISRMEFERYHQQRIRHEAEEALILEDARNRGVTIVVPTTFSRSH